MAQRLQRTQVRKNLEAKVIAKTLKHLNEEKFIPNPFSDELGVRLYKTGIQLRFNVKTNIYSICEHHTVFYQKSLKLWLNL